MALGMTQPLKEMSTRNVSLGGKGCGCVRLTDNLTTFMCRLSRNSGSVNPAGALMACSDLYGVSFSIYNLGPLRAILGLIY